jgi:hypothetical protein
MLLFRAISSKGEINHIMYTQPYRRELFNIPYLIDEDLLFLGIKKFFKKYTVINIDENHSPEGDEWDFLYDGKLNRLYVEKRKDTYVFSGDITPDLLAALQKMFGKPLK